MTSPLRPVACLWAVALVAACSPAEEPQRPAVTFRTDGATYVWRAADDGTGRLFLAPAGETGEGSPALVIRCETGARGGVSVAAFHAEPIHPPLALTAGGVTLTVAARVETTRDRTMIGGDGPLPSGWFEALAAAERLGLRYGDQGLEIQAPGRALAEAFGKTCREAREAG